MTDCPYAKSDMTPCFQRDRHLALTDRGMLNHFCVGCSRRVYPTNQELIEYEELMTTPPPKKKRR